MDWPQEKDKKHVANGFHGFFLIEHSNGKKWSLWKGIVSIQILQWLFTLKLALVFSSL